MHTNDILYTLLYKKIILTKSDLVNQIELEKALELTFEGIESSDGATCLPFVHCISCLKTQSGIESLKLSISEIYSHNWLQ